MFQTPCCTQVSAQGADGVEVKVPLREGADANAVLAELMEGFASRKAGGGSQSSSMQVRLLCQTYFLALLFDSG